MYDGSWIVLGTRLYIKSAPPLIYKANAVL